MTENEAIKELKLIKHTRIFIPSDEVWEMAIQALEEIQRYRAMEEKLNGISVEQVVNGFINTVENQTEEPYERGRILTNSDVDMWNGYRAIGTIEEFRQAMRFKEYFMELYDEGLEVANWHKNGDLEPLVNFIDEACS